MFQKSFKKTPFGDLKMGPNWPSRSPQEKNPTWSPNLVASGSVLGCLWSVLGASRAVTGAVLEASWGVLAVSWSVLGASCRHLGPSQARLGAYWARLGGFLARLARMFTFWVDFSMLFQRIFIGNCNPKIIKNEPPLQPQCFLAYFGFFKITSIFDAIFDLSYLHFGTQKSILGRLGASLGRLGPSWERLGGVLGASWGRLGGFLRRLGSLLGRPGAIFGASWAVLGRRRPDKEQTPKSFKKTGKSGRLRSILDRCGGVLSQLGLFSGHLGRLEASWDRLGGHLGPF